MPLPRNAQHVRSKNAAKKVDIAEKVRMGSYIAACGINGDCSIHQTSIEMHAQLAVHHETFKVFFLVTFSC